MTKEELVKRISEVRKSLDKCKNGLSIEVTPAFIKALLSERDAMIAQLGMLKRVYVVTYSNNDHEGADDQFVSVWETQKEAVSCAKESVESKKDAASIFDEYNVYMVKLGSAEKNLVYSVSVDVVWRLIENSYDAY